MKASRSRIKNAIAESEKRKAGPPKVSKYAAKRQEGAKTTNAMTEALATFKGDGQ